MSPALRLPTFLSPGDGGAPHGVQMRLASSAINFNVPYVSEKDLKGFVHPNAAPQGTMRPVRGNTQLFQNLSET